MKCLGQREILKHPPIPLTTHLNTKGKKEGQTYTRRGAVSCLDLFSQLNFQQGEFFTALSKKEEDRFWSAVWLYFFIIAVACPVLALKVLPHLPPCCVAPPYPDQPYPTRSWCCSASASSGGSG